MQSTSASIRRGFAGCTSRSAPTGGCSEIYREKAFDGTDFRPPERLPVARELGETSLMFPVDHTLSETDMHTVADAVERVMRAAR